MFLGMCNYYAKFVLQYIHIATPLYNLLWKNTKLDLTMDCDTIFKQLKHALVHDPILTIPSFDASFIVKTNATDMAVGAVLMQYNWPVAFMSKVLNPAQQNYHTKDCKLLAIIFTYRRWHPYMVVKRLLH